MKLRTLDHVRFFDAAARAMSFQEAAHVMNVTPAAVSQRIRQLEEDLGVSLFERHVRRVELTEDGLLFSSEVAKALEILDRATSRISVKQESRAVTITTTPTFAEQILLPVLGNIQERVGGCVVRVVVSTDLVNPGTDGVDLAVRQGRGRYSGFRVRRLLSCHYVPVCSPALADGQRTAPLVHVEWPSRVPEPPTWGSWIEKKGPLPFLAKGEVHVSSEAMAIRSAVSGQGYALVALRHVEMELASGTLVLPAGLGNELPSRHHYYLVEPKGHIRDPASKVSEWLVRQFA